MISAAKKSKDRGKQRCLAVLAIFFAARQWSSVGVVEALELVQGQLDLLPRTSNFLRTALEAAIWIRKRQLLRDLLRTVGGDEDATKFDLRATLARAEVFLGNAGGCDGAVPSDSAFPHVYIVPLGKSLELEGRWAQAFECFENALRSIPSDDPFRSEVEASFANSWKQMQASA